MMYGYGDYVRCINRTADNIERLNLGDVYRVVGITPTYEGNDMIYTVMDSDGNLYHSIDRFELVKTKTEPSRAMIKLGDTTNEYRYRFLQSKMLETYIAKNTDYGNSFSKTYEDYGMISVASRISDKYLRLRQLVTTGKAEVKNESIRDTLLDMANYCMMTIMEMDKDEIVTYNADAVPCKNPITKPQIQYIASLTTELGLDRYDLPSSIAMIPNYKELNEAEASKVIDRLLAIKWYNDIE